jgi:sugar/nucleoside kinase (ribokinase family)
MARIVIVGSLNMDLVVRMPTIPRPGETLLGGVFATFPGGKGANQAVAAARLGGQVTMIGRVGALAVTMGERRSLVEAARFANAAAALSVTRPGAQPSLPTRSEVNRLMSFGL